MGLVFYTVLLEREGCPVKYMVPLKYYVETFSGPFDCPGEASQEFQISIRAVDRFLQCYYLDEDDFRQRVRLLAEMRREDARKLKAWLKRV